MPSYVKIDVYEKVISRDDFVVIHTNELCWSPKFSFAGLYNRLLFCLENWQCVKNYQ